MSELSNIRKSNYSSNKVVKASGGGTLSKTQVLKGLEDLKSSDPDNASNIDMIKDKINKSFYSEFGLDSFTLKDENGLDIDLGARSQKDKSKSKQLNSELIRKAMDIGFNKLKEPSTKAEKTFEDYYSYEADKSLKNALNTRLPLYTNTKGYVEQAATKKHSLMDVGTTSSGGDYYSKIKLNDGKEVYQPLTKDQMDLANLAGLQFDDRGVLLEPKDGDAPELDKALVERVEKFKNYLLQQGLIEKEQADNFVVSGGRSTRKQAYLWLTHKEGVNAPGTSLHEHGKAMDLNISKSQWEDISKHLAGVREVPISDKNTGKELFQQIAASMFGLNLKPHHNSYHVELYSGNLGDKPKKKPEENKSDVVKVTIPELKMDILEVDPKELSDSNTMLSELPKLNIPEASNFKFNNTSSNRYDISPSTGKKRITKVSYYSSEPYKVKLEGNTYTFKLLKYRSTSGRPTISIEAIDDKGKLVRDMEILKKLIKVNNVNKNKLGGVLKYSNGNTLNYPSKVLNVKSPTLGNPNYSMYSNIKGLNFAPLVANKSASSIKYSPNNSTFNRSTVGLPSLSINSTGPANPNPKTYQNKDSLLKSLSKSVNELALPAAISAFNLANKAKARIEPLRYKQSTIRPIEGINEVTKRSMLQDIRNQSNEASRPLSSSSRLNALSKISALDQLNKARMGLAGQDAQMYAQDKARYFGELNNDRQNAMNILNQNIGSENQSRLATAQDLVNRKAMSADVWSKYFANKQQDAAKRKTMTDYAELQDQYNKYSEESAQLDKDLSDGTIDKDTYKRMKEELKTKYAPTELLKKYLMGS